MASIHDLSPSERHALLVRLERIEGQARGIERMIEDGRDCLDVLTQIAAMRAATNALAAELLEDYALRCLRHPDDFGSNEHAVEQAIHLLVRGSR